MRSLPAVNYVVRSTHRAPSPFISSFMRHGEYGVGSGSWHFPPPCASSVCVERSRASTSERATRAWPIKGAEDLSENCDGVTADPSRTGDRALNQAGSRMPVETPSQRDPAAAHEERGVVIFAGSVSMKFGG